MCSLIQVSSGFEDMGVASHAFDCFVGQHQCFELCAGSNWEPIEGAEKWERHGHFGVVGDLACCNILVHVEGLSAHPGMPVSKLHYSHVLI